MLIVLEFLNSTTAAMDERILKALQQIAQQPISGLKLYSIPQKPTPPSNRTRKRKERGEGRSMKEKC
jgi:hypothetical protein